MKTLILTGYSESMREIGELTTPGKFKYAERHNYGCISIPNLSGSAHPAWMKMEIFHNHMKYFRDTDNPNFTRIHWIDADILVTNPEIPLPPIPEDKVFMASLDWMPNADNFTTGAFSVDRNHDRAYELFERAETYGEFHPEVYWNGQLDQAALQAIAGASPELFHVVPRRVFAAVPAEIQNSPEPWQEGDFCAHLTGVSNAQRADWLKGKGAKYL